MPNRIIKESICTSDSIDQLSWFEEVLFYRLIVNCDDYGRFDGRPAIIKNRLFPLKENLTAKTVSGAINKLASAGLIVLYVFEDKPYLYLPTWNHHQNVRAKRSKYPSPGNGRDLESIVVNTSEIKCDHVYADVPVIQSNTKSESISESKESDFDAFWAAYPRKVGKADARKAFKKAKAPLDTLLAAIDRQKQSDQWQKSGGQYIPNPATWLNQGRWEDELPTAGYQKIPTGSAGTAPLGSLERDALVRILGGQNGEKD